MVDDVQDPNDVPVVELTKEQALEIGFPIEYLEAQSGGLMMKGEKEVQLPISDTAYQEMFGEDPEDWDPYAQRVVKRASTRVKAIFERSAAFAASRPNFSEDGARVESSLAEKGRRRRSRRRRIPSKCGHVCYWEDEFDMGSRRETDVAQGNTGVDPGMITRYIHRRIEPVKSPLGGEE